MMACNRWALFLAAWALGFSSRAEAEGGSRWRVYRAADGLGESSVVAVTISPRANVWAKHPNGSISWLDGYQARSIPLSSSGNFPAYESRSGQIWSAYAEGVMEYRRDQWVQYPVNEIRAETQSNPLRLFARPIPLLPAERDHVLAALPDRLLEFDAGQNRTVVLRWASESILGRFNDIVEARDGGAWLSGTNGLAKLPGPVRRLSPESRWQEFPTHTSWQIQNLERPFEDDEGGVTVAADSLASGGRVVLYFNGQTWTAPFPAPDKTRCNAWRDVDGTFWAATRGGLFRREGTTWTPVQIPGLHSPQFYDVCTEVNGVFWLATTEGLVRHSLKAWRAPAGWPAIQSATFSIFEDREGALWFASSTGLFTVRDLQLRFFPWPAGFPGTVERSGSLFGGPDGRILVSWPGRIQIFDPLTGLFSTFGPFAGCEVRAILGEFKPGEFFVQTFAPGSPTGFRIDRFTGKGLEPFFEPKADWSIGDDLTFLRTTEDETIWLGSSLGLGVWDPRTKTFEQSGTMPRRPAVELLEAGKGKIWYATTDAIFEFNGRAWSAMPFSAGQIRAARRARDGSIWVASSGGLWRFTEGSWVSIGAEEGLPAKDVWDVRQDRHFEIWTATEKGISLYHRSADLDPPVASISDAENPKEVYASEVVTFSVRGRDKWDCTRPERLLFSHRLDDAPWSPYLPEATVTFTNVPAGKHRLTVRAMDRNWNEGPEPEVYEFISVVPWFREPRLLAIAACGAVATLFLAWLAVNRHLRLLRSYAEVEKIVAQRTKELERANQELLHSQKMRAMGTLAAGIAHDFNSILSIIRGSAQIIETNLEDREKVRTRIDRIKAMVEQGSGIVKAMLGFIRTGQEEKLCNVNQLVSETKRLLGDQFHQELVLRFEPLAALPRVRGVGELIQQMLLNLILNAADAMSGRGEIVLRTGLLEQTPSALALRPAALPPFVCIAVHDQGSGIAPDILPRIFEPFFTTKGFSTRRGTGLGLSMVYEIAKEMGYGLSVESAPGSGSTFTILIPAARDTET